EPRRLGRVAIAPLDVVLDAEKALILQPDVLFVAASRVSIIRNQVWGAPDLVVEVFSPGHERWDRHDKFGWYRQYGVREYWLADPEGQGAPLVDFSTFLPATRRLTRATDRIVSAVLPDLEVTLADVFGLLTFEP